ncbi:unnamed protein product [Darwinula stevensoni]|nr:unnamed protein product [Darwinula stevensoni]CAG0901270.1 unnamed protein product [Darwinula stevensoni]
MDAYDIFKKLSKGAHFDFKRFRNDAVKLKMIPDWPKPPLASAAATSKEIEDEGESKDPVPSDASDTSLSLGEDDSGLEDESANDLEGEEEEREEGTRVRLLGDLVADDGDRKKRKRKIKVQGPEHAAAMHREQVNRLKNIHRIHAWGSDIPEPIRTFEDLGSHGIHELVIRNITKMGYESPTPIQMQAIPLLAQRRELLACAPTGSGKTAAFLVPVLSHLKGPEKRGFRAVIVAPTRELAGQIYREALNLAEGLRLKIHIIEKISKAMKKFGPKTAGKYDLLVTTPNRLVYLLKQEPPVLSLANVEWLIVDESDKLFEAGQRGFRDQLAVIYNACGDSSKARRALFSATFAFEVQEWCKLNLDNLAMVSIGARNAAVDTVDQELVYVGNEHGKLVAFRDLVRKGLTPPVLVFVQSKERARELFHELIYDGINVDVIHSDRSKLQRDNVVKGFRRGRIWVLICTELMGRGMDFKGVNLVVNYDFPPSSISYIHRIGRTGRAGRQGKAITFFTEEDKANLRTIAQVVKDSGCEVPDYMLRLKKPTKKEKRSLERRAPKREPISTVTRYDKERKLKRM